MIKRLVALITAMLLIVALSPALAFAGNVSLNLSSDKAIAGDSITATGSAEPDAWVAVKVVDSTPNIVVFDAVKADDKGAYSCTFKVPEVGEGILTVVAGYGSNVANQNLTVKNPEVKKDGTITITGPVGTTSWKTGSTQAITWSLTGKVGKIDIQLLSNGVVVETIAKEISSPPGTYSWQIPSTLAAGSYQIKLVSVSDNTISSTSPAFTIEIPAALNITSPAADTSWKAGSTQNITWSTTGNAGNIAIQLLNGGVVSETIAPGIDSALGTYSWQIPNTLAAGSYQIKLVSNSDNSVTATSAAFAIAAEVTAVDEGITVSCPAEGDNWITETKQTITWTFDKKIGKVNVLLLKDNEIHKTLASKIPVERKKYVWQIPATIENATYQVKVVSIDDTSIYGISDEFTISAPVTSVTLISPSGEASWEPGSKQTIKWSYEGKINKVNILLMQNEELVKTIASASANKKSYKWTVPEDLDGTYQIKIVNADNDDVYDTSDSIVISAPATSVTLTSPSSVASWEPGSKQTIKWGYEGKISKVNLLLMQNDELVKTIANVSANKKSYKWTVPKDLDGTYQIKIVNAANAEVFDTSDDITIAAPEVTLNLTSPSEGAVWKLKKKQTIKWSYTGAPGKVTVSLYKGDTVVKQIASVTCKKGKTAGSCKYTPKGLEAGDDYYIVITSTSQPGVTDESGEFSIQ